MTSIKAVSAATHHDWIVAVRELSEAMPKPQRQEPPSSRSLAPREHGAYGQVALPLMVALASGTPHVAAAVVSGGAVLAFLAHEPVLVAAGLRGRHAQRSDGRRALRWALGFGGGAGVLYAGGAALAPPDARWALLGCALLVALVVGTIARRAERTLVGELLVAATLPALAVPVALCTGSAARLAVGVWLTWALGSAAATCAVRDVIAHLKTPRSTVRRLLAIGLVAAAACGAFAAGALTAPMLALTAPMVLVSLAIVARPPHPRRLKQIGWTLVIASTVTAAGLLLLAHLG